MKAIKKRHVGLSMGLVLLMQFNVAEAGVTKTSGYDAKQENVILEPDTADLATSSGTAVVDLATGAINGTAEAEGNAPAGFFVNSYRAYGLNGAQATSDPRIIETASVTGPATMVTTTRIDSLNVRISTGLRTQDPVTGYYCLDCYFAQDYADVIAKLDVLFYPCAESSPGAAPACQPTASGYDYRTLSHGQTGSITLVASLPITTSGEGTVAVVVSLASRATARGNAYARAEASGILGSLSVTP